MKLLIAIAILLASLGAGVDSASAHVSTVDPPKIPPKASLEGPNIR